MTLDQFDIINRRLDQLLPGQAELQGDAKSLAANVGRLSAKVEALPTLLDIYAGSFRLLALTFLPIWAVLLAGMLVIRWS